MSNETITDFLDNIQEADFVEILRLGERNCITALVGSDLRLSYRLARKIAEVASFQRGKTILLVNSLNDEEDKYFLEDNPDNLEVVECGYNDYTGFIAAMSRIATTDEDAIIVSEATPCFRTDDMLNQISDFGECCNQFREEVNRLGKDMKLILIGHGEPNELSSCDSVWFDNIMDIQKTQHQKFYFLKDRKSNHYPLRKEIVGFSLENDIECIQTVKEKSKKSQE